MVSDPYPILGLETVLPSLFLPSRNHNLHAGITCRMMRCNACMSLRFGSGWLVIYFWICFCTFILNIRLRVAYDCVPPSENHPQITQITQIGKYPNCLLFNLCNLRNLWLTFRAHGGQTIPLLPAGPERKEVRAPRPAHRRRWRPCAPTPAPRPYRQLPGSRNRPCAPWSRCMAHR